ncbi:MAG: ClcB-like voltage-gated chloride channel protein [Burkholderiaceae bacterium]
MTSDRQETARPSSAGRAAPRRGGTGLARLLRWRLRLEQVFRFSEANALLLWACVTGVLGALATIAFRDCIKGVEYLLGSRTGSLVQMAISLPWYGRLLLPAAGGVVAGAFLVLAARYATRAASDYMEAVAIGDGRIPLRQTLLRSLSSMSSIASGGSIGREGSMVQLAALCASVLGRIIHFEPSRLRMLVACGAAAGITSAYNTPLAGAFFVSEIVLGSIAMESFGPIVVSAVVANLTMRSFHDYQPTYAMPVFPTISGLQAVGFAVLGLIAGLLSPQFLRLLGFSRDRFRRTGLPLPARLGLGGLLVGLVSVWVPQVWGNGYSVVNSLLHQPWAWSAVLVVLVAKIVATALTTGSGAVGGVFTPTLFVGAAIGFLFGSGAQALLPNYASEPYAYAVVGMGAFLAAATYAPLMAILIIFEMTLAYQVVLPLIPACILAVIAARALGETPMYEITSRRNREERERLQLRGIVMQDLIRPAKPVLPAGAPFDEMTRMFLEYPVKYLYVIDAGGHYQGVVALHDLTSALAEQGDNPGDNESKRAADFVRRDFLHVLTPEMSLGEALQLFLRHQGERLPIVHDKTDPVLLGVVYKSALLDACFRLSGSPQ